VKARHGRIVHTIVVLAGLLTLSVAVGSLPPSDSVLAAAPFKVAYMPIGPITDKSWSQSGYEGLLRAKKEFNLEIAYTEDVPPADAERIARGYAQRGYNLILLHGGQFVDAAQKAAADFPKTWFCVAGGNVSGPNVCSYDPLQQEGPFVVGALAALVSKSGRLGLVGGFAFPALTRQLEGFKLGARFVNPSIKFQEVYINTWDDIAKGRNATTSLIDSGADVIFAATDKAAQGIFAVAEQRGVYAVAQYADQNHLAPKAILGSILYDLGGLVYQVTKLAHAGRLEGKVYTAGLAQGVGEFVYNDQLDNIVTPEVKAKVSRIKQQIISGTLRVPSTAVLGKPGSSDNIDPHSLVQ
jgi:basic membrane protein A and related proteins